LTELQEFARVESITFEGKKNKKANYIKAIEKFLKNENSQI
jgi:hypothetical protein